jgi:hypothetical protein
VEISLDLSAAGDGTNAGPEMWSLEPGDRRQETGDRRQETGDRKQETGGRSNCEE